MEIYQHVELDGWAGEHRRTRSRYPDKTTIADGFNYVEAAQAVQGPVIEIAGPTDMGFHVVEDFVPRQPFITNINRYDWMPDDSLHLLADGRALPFRDGSVGMVLAACVPFLEDEFIILPNEISHPLLQEAHAEYLEYSGPGSEPGFNQRIQIIEEVSRVLSKGGIFVWGGGEPGDVRVASYNNLELKQWRSYENGGDPSEDDLFDECVFLKS